MGSRIGRQRLWRLALVAAAMRAASAAGETARWGVDAVIAAVAATTVQLTVEARGRLFRLSSHVKFIVNLLPKRFIRD
jgi:predicted flavoprotein YhiN